MSIKIPSKQPVICYKADELKEKIIECLIDLCVEKDILIITEFTYELNERGFTLNIGGQKIICPFNFDKKDFTVLLARVYKKYLKLAEMNKRYCISSVFFDGEKITADLASIN